MFHNPRAGRGGGTAVLCRNDLRCTKQHVRNYSSFEVTEVLVKCGKDTNRVCSVYRSPTQADSNLFFEEFEEYLVNVDTKPGEPIVCGDLNFHLELDNDNLANRFKTLYSIIGFNQHVSQATHGHGG